MKTLDAQNINALGGIIIDDENEEKLIHIMKAEKGKYTHSDLPIKWNFKDTEVKAPYKEFNRIDEYETMLRNSRDIRLNIIRESLRLDYKIVFSCIENYSIKKDIIKSKKEVFSELLFENILQRVGLEARECKGKYQIVMDWPTEGNPKPYNRTYYHLYNNKDSQNGRKSICGALCNLGFKHSVFFTKTTHSPCLQFVDMIVGALKDYIEMYLYKTQKSCVGKEAYDLFKTKIRSHNGKIMGCGIIVPSQNRIFRKTMENLFERNCQLNEVENENSVNVVPF